MINNGKTILYIATSLDGYVAGSNDEIEWLNRYNNVDFGLKEFLSRVGAIIMGRRSYDMGVEHKWFSQYNYGVPIFVVSHEQPVSINKDTEFIFVTEGIESAYK
jgi:dihydrofolate reductase